MVICDEVRGPDEKPLLYTVKALSEWLTDTEERSGSGWVSGFSRKDAGEKPGEGQLSLSQNGGM